MSDTIITPTNPPAEPKPAEPKAAEPTPKKGRKSKAAPTHVVTCGQISPTDFVAGDKIGPDDLPADWDWERLERIGAIRPL